MGVAERSERLLVALVAAGLTGLGVPFVLAIGLWAVALGSTVTFGQRVWVVRKAVAALVPRPGPEQERRQSGLTSARGPARAAAGYALGWKLVCRAARILGPRARSCSSRDIAWRRQGPRVMTLEGNLRRVLGPAATGKQLRALSRQTMRSYSRYWLEVFRLPVIPLERIMAGMHCHRRGKAAGQPERPAAGSIVALPHTGQLRAGRLLDHQPRGGLVHHGGRAAQARVAVPPVPGLPRGAGHGGAARHRRRQPVRHPGPAAAGRPPGLPGRPTGT